MPTNKIVNIISVSATHKGFGLVCCTFNSRKFVIKELISGDCSISAISLAIDNGLESLKTFTDIDFRYDAELILDIPETVKKELKSRINKRGIKISSYEISPADELLFSLASNLNEDLIEFESPEDLVRIEFELAQEEGDLIRSPLIKSLAMTVDPARRPSFDWDYVFGH